MARSTPGAGSGWLRSTLRWGFYLAAFTLFLIVVAVAIAYSSLPSYQTLAKRTDLEQTVRVRAADGTVLQTLGPTYGRWLRYAEIPQTMRTAMISVEDRRFRYHPGVDPIGLGRALAASVRDGERIKATSTITQQLARNIFLTNKREIGRKVREAILSFALEAKFSKDEILELYLNRVYFGGGAYGVDAASRTFFGHGAEKLSLGEAAIIAGLVKAPSRYSPTADIEAARGRAQVVLQQMVRNGFVSEAAIAGVDPAAIKLQPPPKQNNFRYFTDWALPQLDTLIDESNDPIEVWTTIDLSMQNAASRAINANTPRGAQGALVAIDRDGAVRALIGGRDYASSIYNRATQAQRQPGSAWKLFVYLTALESGMRPTDTVVDEPVTVDGWSPRNSTRTFIGPISLREAFARSINTISAKIGDQLGFATIADMARRFGITTNISTYPSMVLGSSEVRLIELTRAFASVGNRGVGVMPYGIRRVTSADGRLLYQHSGSEQRELVAPYVAAEMTDLMQTAVLSGTGRAAQIGRPVAGKTGTTSSNKDGWFVGFSSGLTTGVWMGRDDNRAIPGLQGGTAPARAFHDFMVVAVAKRPVEQFQTDAAIPDWQLEPDEEMFNYMDDSPMVDADGNPIYPPGQIPTDPMMPGGAAPRPGDQQWLDDVLNRPAPSPAQPPQPQPGVPLPAPPPQPGRDPLAPRSGQPNPAQVGGQPAQR